MKTKTEKPAKPVPDFPLFPHDSGKWAKKIGGKLRYFGRWSDPRAALAEYQAFLGTIGDHSSPPADGLLVEDACNLFLAAKDEAMARGELSTSSFADYRRTCMWVVDQFGRQRTVESLMPANFAAYKAKLAERRTVGSLGNEITRVRVLFKWCWDARHITAPVHFGPDFRKPSAKVMRRHRREQGKKLFTPAEIHAILDECGVHLRAMVLLGINAGFGPTDLATLTLGAINAKPGWIDYPRPKTEIDRRIPLWRETRIALARSLRRRAQPKPEATNLVFVRPDGLPLDAGPITKKFHAARLASLVGVGSFYWLRHCCETIGGGAKDQVAVNAIMGHADHSMAATYREEINDARLVAVVEHVGRWLFSR